MKFKMDINTLIAIIVICATLLFSKLVNAEEIYKVDGSKLNVSVKVVEFYNLKEAQEYCTKVNGQLFKEKDQELYRVITGVEISDVAIITNME